MSDFNEQDILAAVNAEVSALTPEQLQADLLKFRVRQKVQQKKNYGSGKQKEYQAKQREKFKALKAAAIKAGLWDAIEKQADEEADAKLSADGVDAEQVDENE
jgi:hypothetical protein